MTVIVHQLTAFQLTLASTAAASLTAVGTALVRRYALASTMLDIPNHRSSHATPTARGGGLAITVVLLTSLVASSLLGVLPWRTTAAFASGGSMVALVGWIDDRRGVRASVRASVHFSAAVLGVALLRGLPVMRIGSASWPLGAVGFVLAVFGTVWFINLYNFMDGIDGIASGNAVVVTLAGAALLVRSGDLPLALVALLLAGCSAGFLAWNWPPAKIFLGDSGSGLLGYILAILALASERRGSAPLLLWVLLMGVFVADATLTLFRRVMRGERWYDAHRSHAYQRLVQAGWSHRTVSIGVVVLDIALGGAALLALPYPNTHVPLLAGVFVLLGGVYFWVERVYPMPTTVVSTSHS